MYDTFLPIVVKPRQEARAVPVLVWCISVPVRPENLWLVFEHELVELRQRFHCGEVVCSINIGSVQLIQWVEPLKKGVIESNAEVTVCTKGTDHLTHHIPFGSNIYGVPVPRGFGAPEGKTWNIHPMYIN